jgi:hypothetical protein
MHLPREIHVTLPELALIAGTRGAAGFGLGLLLANCMNETQRRAIGWTLLLVGGLSTIPLAFEVFGRRGPSAAEGSSANALGPYEEVMS